MTKSKKTTAEDSDVESDEEGMTEKDRKVAAMKARLAEMQRAKGKGKALDEDGFPPGTFRKERTTDDDKKEVAKREHKHA